MLLSLCVAASHHFIEGDWNQIHPCFEVQHEQVIAGGYKNSEGNFSAFIGYEFPLTERLNAEVGIVSGYNNADILPMLRATYDLDPEGRSKLFMMPAAVTDTNTGKLIDVGIVVGAQFSFFTFDF